MMRAIKLYEQPKLIVLTLEEDVITTSSSPDGGGSDVFDKGIEDFF